MYASYIHASGSRIIYMDTCIMDTSAWVTRPERPKGAKDEVKEARKAKSRPVGPLSGPLNF